MTDAEQRELEALRRSNAELVQQVKGLVRSRTNGVRRERRERVEHDLDRKLLALNQRINRSQSLQYIFAQIPVFVCRELGFQRCVLFVDDRRTGVFTVRASDGYHNDEERRRVAACEVPEEGPLFALVRNSVHPVHLVRSRDPQLRPVAHALDLEAFLVAPLRGSKQEIIGFLVAGNESRGARGYTPVRLPSSVAEVVVATAEVAGNAVSHCVLYWELAVERNLLEARIRERTAELQEVNRRMRGELEQARDFQQSILDNPPRVPGMEFDVLYRPLDLVGGDVYDVHVCPDGRIQLFVADATGHGVGASLATMFIKGEYDQNIESGGPAELLRVMNDNIARLYGRLEMRFTAVCMELDPRGRQARYATAGHPPPCRLRDGAIEELESGGAFMGIVPGVDFPEWTTDFRPGDGLYLFSDGALEEWGGGDIFGEERLYETIREAVRGERSVTDAVTRRIEEFVSGRELSDDLTLLGVRWTGGKAG